MEQRLAPAPPLSGALELPTWKMVAGTAAALIIGLLFILSGVWKISDPFGWSARVTQLLVPASVSLPFAILLGVGEAFSGVLLLIPRYRRWGAWLTIFFLIAFMAYVGIFYDRLRGEDCSCFPWVKRAVGPMFFIGDILMLLAAAAAGLWARTSQGLRPAVIILGALFVFAGASAGINYASQSGIKAPDTVTVDGQPFSLQRGRILLYFFDPECSHCDEAARRMATWNWKDTSVVAVSTRMPQFTGQFLSDTKLRAVATTDYPKLKQVFQFGDPPYAVALENGRQKAALQRFDQTEPKQTLARMGYVE